MDETKPPGIAIAQIFLLAAHFEHGQDPLVVPAQPMPLPELKTKIEVRGGHSEDESQAFVHVIVSTVEDENSIYRFRVEMLGLLVREKDAPNLALGEYVSKGGAALMFPFLREAVANITGRGRFGPIWLKPVNMLALTTTEPPPQAPPPSPPEG